MNKDYTHILFIIDDSGSMRGLLDDSIGGFNAFVDEQKKLDGKCKMHTMTFGSAGNQNYIHENLDIQDVPELTQEDHGANSGMTALLDSIGKGINDLGQLLKEMDEEERPSKVLVNIFTDGAENDSKEFTQSQVTDMIEEQTDKYNWEFAFLASDLSASNLARSMGISNVAVSDNSSAGMRGAYTSMMSNATSYRTLSKTVNVQDEYDKAVKEEAED